MNLSRPLCSHFKTILAVVRNQLKSSLFLKSIPPHVTVSSTFYDIKYVLKKKVPQALYSFANLGKHTEQYHN